MPPASRQIAEAFSTHDFPTAYPHLADDVRWDLVGADVLEGKDAVLAACEATASELTGVATTVKTSRVVEGIDGSVVVDSTVRYVDPDGTASVVASCDLYAFSDGLITAIRSYTVELDGSAPAPTV